jgi:hypothetical protein
MEGQSSPLLQSASQPNILGYQNIGGGDLAPSFPFSFYSIPRQVIWPYMQQWHFDIQHEMPHNTVLTVSYVGSKGTHLGRQTDLNQLHSVPLTQNPYKPGEPIGGNGHDDCGTMQTPSGVDVTGQAAINLQVACGADANPFRPYYGLSTITRLEPKASSSYHALQVAARRTFGGLILNAAYTYSHSIDDASDRYDAGFVDSYNPRANRASSSFDARHLLNVGYVYDLPFFKQPGLSHTVLGGWQWSGIVAVQTGTPFSAFNGTTYGDNAGVGNAVATNGGGAASLADRIGDPKAGIPAASSAAEGFAAFSYNPGAYALPRGLTFGNSGRNSLRNPRRTNFDMAIFKRFAVKESLAFEFRAEAFNVFNHPQWNPIAGDAGSGANNNSSGTNSMTCFGGANNSAGDPSCLGAQGSNFLQFGSAHNPRILQLGAKFIF